MQIAISKRMGCDFVVWLAKSMFVERVMFNKFWETNSMLASMFHKNVVLPELLGKIYTRPLLPATGAPEKEVPYQTVIILPHVCVDNQNQVLPCYVVSTVIVKYCDITWIAYS